MAHFSLPRSVGLLAPLFAIGNRQDLGIGDTRALRSLVDWCHKHGIHCIQTLPINETGDDHSPYNAISAMALEPTTLSMSPIDLPGMDRETYEKTVAEWGTPPTISEPVDYIRIKSIKRKLLEHAFNRSAHCPDFDLFLQEASSWIDAYCHFRLLFELHAGQPDWQLWPVEHQSFDNAKAWIASHPDTFSLSRRLRFFAFIQWVAYRQWAALRQYAETRGIKLLGDIPFGVSRYSADVWANPVEFDLSKYGGAPPEPFFQSDDFIKKWGQNWGIPLYKWDVMREHQWSWWRHRVEWIAKIFHAFRIDHVLGFYRIYSFPWPPSENADYVPLSMEEARAKAGDIPRFLPGPDEDPHWHYWNKVFGEEVLIQLSEAAGSTSIIAEDLGCVPDYVRPSLTWLGIPGFKIPLFERLETDKQYKDSNAYPELSVATLGTHDHLPMAALWDSWRESVRNASSDSSAATWEMRCLLKWAGLSDEVTDRPYDWTLHHSQCKKLFQSPSLLAVLQLSDWFRTKHRFNVPGLATNANWTQRFPWPVEEWDTIHELLEETQGLETLIEITNRKVNNSP